MHRASVGALGVFLGLVISGPLLAQEPGSVGQVEAASSTELVANGHADSARGGQILRTNDILRTGDGGAARVVLADGSSLQIAERTELRVVRHDRDTQQTLIELLRGHVQASATAVSKQGGFFRIHTPTAVVYALGTDLDVRTESPAATTVSGSVQIVNAGAPVGNADVVLMLANLGKVALGKTDDQGRRQVALDLANGTMPGQARRLTALEIANLGKVPFHAEVDECQDGSRQVLLVDASSQLPAPAKNCRRRRLIGVLMWGDGTPQRVTLDLARGTLDVAAVAAESAADAAGVPRDLADIAPGAATRAPGVKSLSDFRSVGRTIVTCLSHSVAVTSLDVAIKGVTYLMPGQASVIDRDAPPQAGVVFDDPRITPAAARRTDTTRPIAPVSLREVDAAGKPCNPSWVINGELASGEAKFDYKITGLGRSTGSALSVKVTNESSCALYFLVTDGVILHPKGFTERIVVSLLVGGVPSIKDFQKMITVGGFVRVAPGRSANGAVVPGEATLVLRSYCVELHKVEPLTKTEYKFGDEDDQKTLGLNRRIVDRVFLMAETRQITLTELYALDEVLQWSLWSTIEHLTDQKKFLEEFLKLVHKNYVAGKKKWDNAAERDATTLGTGLWRLVDSALKTPA